MRDLSAAGWRIYLEFERWRVKYPKCMSVNEEHLDWLAKNPRYTYRLAMHVGNLCRDMTIIRIAEIERLHHSTVKDFLQTVYAPTDRIGWRTNTARNWCG